MEENENQNVEERTSGGDGEITLQKNKKLNFIAKIGCLLLAFIIWYAASDNGNAVFEKEINSVSVEIRGESEYSVLSGSGATVNIVISGKRGTVNAVSPGDIKAYISLSDVTKAGECRLPIHYELPDGLTFVSGSTESVLLYMDNTAAYTVPVKVELAGYKVHDGFEIDIDEIQTDIQNVMVTGPTTMVSKVASALLAVDLGSSPLERSITCRGTLVPVDMTGEPVRSDYIKLSNTSASATVPVYKRKSIPAVVRFTHGYLSNDNCDITIVPAVIRVIGDPDAVDSVSFSYSIDEKEIHGKATMTYDVSLPDGVRSVDDVQKITVTIEPKNMKEHTIIAKNYKISGNKDINIKSVKLPTVTVFGDEKLVSSMTSEDITITIDVSSLNGNDGEYEVPVGVSISQKYYGKVYELSSSYSAKVRIGA